MVVLGVERARRDESKIIESFPVWAKVPCSKMPRGAKMFGPRWIDVNKQDEQNPLYRGRLVAREIKKGLCFDKFFAAMPSLSALKMLIAIAVTFNLPIANGTSRKAYGQRRLLGFLDVARERAFIQRQQEKSMWNCQGRQKNPEKTL